MEDTPEYRTWAGMKSRCSNPKDDHYQDYGGRGITVCQEWRDSFLAFYNYIGPKPEPKSLYSIDRIRVNGNYEPGNVRWLSHPEQQLNKRNTVDREKIFRLHAQFPELLQREIAELAGCSKGSVSKILRGLQ